MQLSFTKMHGLGNDFVVLSKLERDFNLPDPMINKLSDRHCGIGFDQLLIIEPPHHPDSDVFLRIINADGSESGQCGNGMRCVARLLIDKGWVRSEQIRIETIAGVFAITAFNNEPISVCMGEPIFVPEQIPFKADAQAQSYCLELEGKTYQVSVLSMGNPHCVVLVEDIDLAPVSTLGPQLQAHQRFPLKANIGFSQITEPTHLKLRVFERGVGETSSCGSGACAAAVAGKMRGLLNSRVDVQMPGGHLQIQWRGLGHPVWMSGEVETVFEGQINL